MGSSLRGGAREVAGLPDPALSAHSVSDLAQGGRVGAGALLQPRVCVHREPYLWGEGGEAERAGGGAGRAGAGHRGEQERSHGSFSVQIPHIKVGPEETPRLQYLRFASVSLYPSNEDVSLAVSRILKSFNYPSASLICAKAECEEEQGVEGT